MRDKIKDELENKQIAPAEEFQSSRKKGKGLLLKRLQLKRKNFMVKISKEKL